MGGRGAIIVNRCLRCEAKLNWGGLLCRSCYESPYRESTAGQLREAVDLIGKDVCGILLGYDRILWEAIVCLVLGYLPKQHF